MAEQIRKPLQYDELLKRYQRNALLLSDALKALALGVDEQACTMETIADALQVVGEQSLSEFMRIKLDAERLILTRARGGDEVDDG
jgi:hypothetical protein